MATEPRLFPSSAPASAALPCRVRGRYWAPQRPLRRPALATDLGRGDRACRGPAATGSERKNRLSGFADERQQIIRESHSRRRGETPAGRLDGHGAERQRLLAGDPEHLRHAVSYTHLRAHETPEHL